MTFRAIFSAMIALIVALFAVPVTTATADVPSVDRTYSFTYDGHHHSTVPTYTKTERGPPANFDQATTTDTVASWSNGASAHTFADTTPVVFPYDHPAPLVQVASVAPPAQRQGDDAKGDSVAPDRAGVDADSGRTAARSCLRSFSGSTLVLMADGTKKPIEDVEVGDEVVATDPETGERVTRKVTRVWVHDDQILDLVVDGEVITTTEDHLFWSVTDQQFERADELAVGEVVLGDGGRQLTVSGFRPGTARTALAYNLSIAGVHTYHVGNDEVLVHNDCDWNARTPLPSGETAGAVGRRIWGHGTPSPSRLDDLTPEDLRGIASLDDALQLRDWYAAADAAGTGGATAPIRVQLTNKIIDAWRTQ